MTRVSVLVAVIMFLCVSSSFAKPIDKDKALKAAKTFLVVRYPSHDQNSIHTLTSRGRSALRAKEVLPLMVSDELVGYVVNLEPSGFVVFSADDETPPVKIYSDSGSFEELPGGLKRVLELELLEDSTAITSNKIRTNTSLLKSKRFSEHWSNLTSDVNQNSAETFQTASEGTTIPTTAWDQGNPYNYYAPAVSGGSGGRAYTGCVATALAQILRYYSFPPSVLSNSTYTDNWGYCQGTHSISDAGMGAYDWANMPSSISTSSPNAQKQAVGQLMYHCGVALKSDYEPNGTGAYPEDVPGVLRTYFGYTSDDLQYKDSYTDAQWYDKIKSDIDNDKPVLYSMEESDYSDGHEVVCDGYRNGNEIHLNLGWSGAWTAWYNIDTVAAYDYIWTIHSAVFNITPTAQPPCDVGAYSGGCGTAVNPYQIATKADLLALRDNTGDYGKCFILTANIDLGGQVFTTAIIAADTNSTDEYHNFQGVPFWGTFDGGGHKITHFTINGNGYLGLFGYTSGGSVKNLGLENFTVSGSNSYYVGGLVGFNYVGSISNCYSTGAVSGSNSYCAGGLVGYNGDGISNCYSTGAVIGSQCVGGLVGYNGSSISNCYSTGTVSASFYVGGLVGAENGNINKCYYLTTSGQHNGYGQPLTDGQMKQKASFVGWDFSNIWTLNEGIDYPELAWQSSFNIALNKKATQSSTYSGYAASRAADGNMDGILSHKSVMMTNLEAYPWWQVDLGGLCQIDAIEIWNRTDSTAVMQRLNDFYVIVSDIPFDSNDLTTILSRENVWVQHITSYPDPNVRLTVDAGGRYVRIQLGNTNYLNLAEVKVFGETYVLADNVASGKKTNQSSTYSDCAASRAVDGNTDGILHHKSVAMTNSQANPWWQVDLGGLCRIDEIDVWNRTDSVAVKQRLDDFYVIVSDIPFDSNDLAATLSRDNVWSRHITSYPDPRVRLWVGQGGRYVRIQLGDTNYLNLAEVKVFGETYVPAGNIALGKLATQSSTSSGGVASRAVDGNIDGVWSHNSVTMTNLETHPRWEVDLGGLCNIDEIDVWNRTDSVAVKQRLDNFYVIVSDVPFASNDLNTTLSQEGVWSRHITSYPDPKVRLWVGQGGRYVRIQLGDTNYLNLAEVKIYGDEFVSGD